MFVLLRPVGLDCHIACAYCYYKSGHAPLREPGLRMTMETVAALLDGLASFPDEDHTLCLHGGEPLLIGKAWFSDFLERVIKHPLTTTNKLQVGIQTNGILIDREWVELFAKGNVDVSLSIDGPSPVHDRCRIDKIGRGTLTQVLAAIEMLSEGGIKPSAIAVVTDATVRLGASKMLEFFRQTKLETVDFTPYIETDSGVDASAIEAKPDELLQFFCDLFDIWLRQNGPRILAIRTFEQTIGSLLGFHPTVCNRQIGSGCARIPSVMPNGDVFACDLDPHLVNVHLGSLSEMALQEMLTPETVARLRDAIRASFSTIGCETCEMAGMCGMTCPRYTFSGRNLSEYCGMARQFVKHVRDELNAVANTMFHESLEFATQE